MHELRSRVLTYIFNIFPFDIKGDANIKAEGERLISCIIPTYNRTFELDRVLTCLSMQDMNKEFFEVIVIEDGHRIETKNIVRKHINLMNIQLKTNKNPIHSIGALRNQGLELSTGKYILFLDDDTLVLQRHFLSTLGERFQKMPDIDCIVIPGEADRCLLRYKHSYLDRYSFASRCVAYKRQILIKLGGFFNDMSSYEDIELSIRFTVTGGMVYLEKELIYYHPPFYFTSWGKPVSSGVSFFRMLRRYSLPVWLLCYVNALRFLPFILLPSIRLRQWGKISCGFLIAPLLSIYYKRRKDKRVYE